MPLESSREQPVLLKVASHRGYPCQYLLVRPLSAGVIGVYDPCSCRAGDSFAEVPHHAFIVIPVEAVSAPDWVERCAPADLADYRS